MAVKIRLSRIGTKNAPVFRIVAIDERSQRDGQALEILGTYQPVSGKLVNLHEDRVQRWVAQGAVVTDAVKRIQKLYRKQQAHQG